MCVCVYIYVYNIIQQFRPLDMPLVLILCLWPVNQHTLVGVALCHKNWLLRDGYQYIEPTFCFHDQTRKDCYRVLLMRTTQ